ncbi:MAG: lytic murein transglycosylase B [Betaproteobacteria bacterium]|nr:lytic murein transglycosylase B [Betaproteobacteria bacterium]
MHRGFLQAILCLLTAGTAIAAPAVEADPLAVFVQQDAVRSFINLMVQRHGFEAEALERLLAKAQRSDAAIRLSAPTPPGMTPSWNAYRSRFIEPIRLGHGLEFWRENATALTRAERQFGVPAEVIAAIIGVETIYGRNTGNFRIIDVLLTLAFVDGRRPDLYRDELEAFLLWTRESGVDPLEPRGSYAGAIGLPQFMPSSIRRWAVDFDGSGRLDLRASTVDAIGSVANFLAGHGWQTGAGATWEARLSATADLEVLTKEGIEPKFTSAQLAAQGVTSRLAGKNFWVVTRYNRSRYYAMAVLEFATALRKARESAQRAGIDATPKSLKKTTKSRGQQNRSKATKSPKRAPTKKPTDPALN